MWNPVAAGWNRRHPVPGGGSNWRHPVALESPQLLEAGLLLRSWQPRDSDSVYQACQDPWIQRWTTLPSPYLRTHADEFVGEHTRQAWQDGTSAPLGVFDAATGEMLGANGLVSIDAAHGSAEVGFWTAPWARARAVATTATRAVARWALLTLQLRRLVWRAEVGNHASCLVALRVGFRMEGLTRQCLPRPDGHYADGWIASLVSGELREAGEAASVAEQAAATRAKTFGGAQPRLSALTHDGTKISLRELSERDLEPVVRACQDPEAVRWTTVPVPYTSADAAHFIGSHASGRWHRGDGVVFAIADPDDRFAGSIELEIADPDRGQGDVGFLVAPGSRGRGYATAALVALCRWATDALALRRIQWRAYVGNNASLRVAQRAGFQLEGITRAACVQRGQPRDAWTAARLSTDPP